MKISPFKTFILIFCVGMHIVSLFFILSFNETIREAFTYYDFNGIETAYLSDITSTLNYGEISSKLSYIENNLSAIEDRLSNIDNRLMVSYEKRTPKFEVHNWSEQKIEVTYYGLFNGERDYGKSLNADYYRTYSYPKTIKINDYEIDTSYFSCKGINVTGFDKAGKPIIQKRN